MVLIPLYIASNLIEVPNRNVPVQYDINQVEKQQLAATSAVYAAIKVVSQVRGEVDNAREFQGKTTLALNFATSQEGQAQKTVMKAASERDRAS